jgi:hypothetical protein
MFDLDLALRFGAALGLGLLLGLERERKRDAELLFACVRGEWQNRMAVQSRVVPQLAAESDPA